METIIKAYEQELKDNYYELRDAFGALDEATQKAFREWMVMEEFVERETGDRWMFATENNKVQTQEIWNVDEYGDRSYMWEYR